MATSPLEPVTATESTVAITSWTTSLGPASRDRRDETRLRGPDGAHAALESFYRALNHADLDLLTAVWHDDDLVQLDNPVGGILRSRAEVHALYRRIFAGSVSLQITFGDAVVITSPDVVVYAGRETGSYVDAHGARVPISIRTSRVVTWSESVGCWAQAHHHGSIDDAAALAAYQHTVRGAA